MRNNNALRVRMSAGDRMIRLLCRVICLLFFAVFAVPIGYVLISSVKTGSGWSLEGYKLLLHNQMVLTGLKNSILLTVLGTAYSLVLEVPAAYVLSRKDFGWLATLFFHLGHFSIALLPLYLLLKQLGLLNSIWGLILPSGFSVHYTLQLRARMIHLSRELEDAASLDGCGPVLYLLRICIPTIGPTVAVFGFFQACGYWSNTLLAKTLLTDESKYPLTLVLNQLLIQNQAANVFGSGTAAGSVDVARMAEYALCFISALPMILLFLTVQRHVRSLENEGSVVL